MKQFQMTRVIASLGLTQLGENRHQSATRTKDWVSESHCSYVAIFDSTTSWTKKIQVSNNLANKII